MTWCSGLGTGGWLMFGGMLLILLTVVWAVGRLFPSAPAPDPVAVLDGRLAHGDLDVDDYRRLRAELTGGSPVAREGTP